MIRISRPDVADFMRKQLTHDSYIGTAVKSVASGARQAFSHAPMRANHFLFLICAVSALALINLSGSEPAPATLKKPVSDEYHGTTVEDPYQFISTAIKAQIRNESAARS